MVKIPREGRELCIQLERWVSHFVSIVYRNSVFVSRDNGFHYLSTDSDHCSPTSFIVFKDDWSRLPSHENKALALGFPLLSSYLHNPPTLPANQKMPRQLFLPSPNCQTPPHPSKRAIAPPQPKFNFSPQSQNIIPCRVYTTEEV